MRKAPEIMRRLLTMRFVLAAMIVLTLSAPCCGEDWHDLLDFSDPGGTEAKLRALLPAARESENTGYLVELLAQVARTHSRRGNFDEAHRILDEVEPMLSDRYPQAQISYWLERGRTFYLAENRDRAVELFHKAFDLAVEVGSEYMMIDAAHMIAVTEPEFESQLQWTQKALHAAEKATDERSRRWVGSLTTNLAWTYFDREDFSSALKYFEQALAYREKQGKVEPILMARWNVARTYRALGRFEEALEMQKELLAEYESRKLPVYGYVYEELAELYHRKNDPRARAYFQLAYEILSRDVWMVNSQVDRLQRLKDLGQPEP